MRINIQNILKSVGFTHFPYLIKTCDDIILNLARTWVRVDATPR